LNRFTQGKRKASKKLQRYTYD